MARLSLNDADKEVRDWFVSETKALGCEVSVDQMGNIFAVRKGKDEGRNPPVMMGSHLDTVSLSQKFIGSAGSWLLV